MKGDNNHKDQWAVFCTLFHEYHGKLHRYAFTILRDGAAAEDVVQTVFLGLWEKRESVKMEDAIGGYLYRATYTRCLNQQRDRQLRTARLHDLARQARAPADTTAERLAARDLESRIREVLAGLPPQCREVFLKSRRDGLSYREIAEAMAISVKTVEAQMGKALRIFREALRDLL